MKGETIVTAELGEQLLRNMLVSRKFEEQVEHYFSLGMIHGTTHLSIGEEGVAAGTCAGIDPQDWMFATHRGHSQAICKGIDVSQMMAEIFGKSTGVCKGKGGSMHIADKNKGVMGANGILGASFPLACGVALAAQKRSIPRATVLFFGEGSTNEGGFHEGFNLAAVWQLPVLFVCVNNTYGMSTHISKAMRETDLKKRAAAYGIPAVDVDGNDVFAVVEAVRGAREYVVEHGPMMVVEHTYRISGHSKSDGNLYRTKEEIRSWREKCPIRRLRERLLQEGLCTEETLERLEREAAETVAGAVQFALDSPYPGPEDVYRDVYA